MMFKELHFAKNEQFLKKKMKSLKRFCKKKGLGNVKQYLEKSWEPFVALWVQFYRNDFWSGQANTNNISEGRVGSFKKGLKNVTDGSIFSAVEYLLETYIPNDIQDFKALNRNNAWANKRIVRLQKFPFLQNRPPGAVAAINNVYTRAAHAIEKRLYRHTDRGQGRFCVTNTKNGHRYTFTLRKSDCNCVDSVTNVYKIPCIHSVVLILSLKLEWTYFDMKVRRNLRNSLIKVTEAGWTVLGRPERHEDVPIEIYWNDVMPIPSVDDLDVTFELSDNKENIPDVDGDDDMGIFPSLDSTFDRVDSGPVQRQHCRLPTGRSETRLAKQYFQNIHDSAERIKETFYNLLGALHVSGDQTKFASEWLEKGDFLDDFLQRLTGLESMLMVASGGVGGRIPIVSNLPVVRAANKSSGNAQRERRPMDIRTKRQKRKRDHEKARSNLATLRTPLVEAHRPNKKRVEEASRHKKNYERAAKRSRVPKVLHPLINVVTTNDESPESCS